jgi:hypothetical protein
MWLRVAKESRKDIHLSSSEVMEENPPWRMEMLTFGLNNLRHLFSKQVSWVFSPLRLKKNELTRTNYSPTLFMFIPSFNP